MKRFVSVLSVAVMLVAASGVVTAAVNIGVNFGSDQAAMGTDAFDGVAAWTDAPNANGSGAAILGTNTVTVDWSSSNIWMNGPSATSGERLYYGYLDDSGSGFSVTLTGLSAWLADEGMTGYVLRFYRNTDSNEAFTDLDISSGGSVIDTVLFPASGLVYPGTGVNQVSDSSVLSANTITIVSQAKEFGVTRGTLAGVQVIGVLGPVNSSPTVEAGDTQFVRFDQSPSFGLNGSVTDDDLSGLGQIGVDYGQIIWSCPSNPGVVFADASDPHTTVTFPRDGYYQLKLYAQDEVGNEGSDAVFMNVLIPGQVDNRVGDLAAMMTLSEKYQQLRHSAPGIGRLELPAYNYWNEALHGVESQISTIFPHGIAMGAMWDPDLLREIASTISDEARIYNNINGKGLTYFSPVINIARHPRWGRNEEAYGEDPYHVSRMGVAFVKGMQGDDPNYLKTVATVKHLIANNYEEGRFYTSSDINPRELREYYMPAYKAAVTEAGVFSVMSAYNALNGTPCTANPWLLTDVLRGEWGFEGYVVSDCQAVEFLYNQHYYASTPAEAVAMAMNAGVDINCGVYYGSYLETAYNQGLITEAAITHAVENVLRARFKLGEFDPPELVTYTAIPESLLNSQAHQNIALLAAQKAIVLLKNDGILPLDRNVISSVAVIGPNAGRAVLGGYSGIPADSYPISPLEGIETKLSGTGVTVQYLEGTSISGSGIPIAEQYLKPSSGSAQNGLTGEYFNNTTLSGSPVLTRLDQTVDFDWSTAAPDNSVNSDNFSVRWTGVLTPPTTGDYQIGVTSDDGFRLYLDGQLLTEDWTDHPPQTRTAVVALNSGQDYDIVLEYYEAGGGAVAQLVWDNSTYTEAANLAAASDVAIVCVGTDPTIAGERRDMDQYQLPGLQEQMIQAIYAANPNTIVVLINGNPVGFEWTAENVPGIVEAWFDGQSQGTAIADVLFGDYNPGGKLPQTFYRSESQLTDMLDYNIIDDNPQTYLYFEGDVLYPFGHGLSYTQFTYSNLTVTPEIEADGMVIVTFDVQNTGAVAGDEVVQVYVRDSVSTVKTPIRSLKRFSRIHLQPGETATQSFNIPAEELTFYDVDSKDFYVEPGLFEIHIGSSSKDIRLTGGVWVNGDYADCQDALAHAYRLPADVSGPMGQPDCRVDFNDMVVFALEWLQNATGLSADISGSTGIPDETVDALDLEIMTNKWLNQTAP